MVDIGSKAVTHRTAHAEAALHLPPALAALVKDGEIATSKGPVFQTAILAGVMGAKRTSDLIPLCHPLPLDDCKIEIRPPEFKPDGSADLVMSCRVQTHAKTGVEMEALAGVSIAALAFYDMTKSVSPGTVIRDIRLVEKTGGKSDFRAR
jgi:cyclic pyranopterin phosphate synthase